MEKAVISLILFVVLVNFLTFNINPTYSWDEAVYLSMGEGVYRGDKFCEIGGREFDLIDCSSRSRYFVYILGGIFSVFGVNYPIIAFFISLISALTVLISYFLFKKLFGKEKALLATLFVATNYMFIFFSHRIMTEIISTLFLTVSIYFFLGILKDKGPHKIKNVVPLSLALGFSIMFRFNFIAIPVSMILYLVIFERSLLIQILKSRKFYLGLAVFGIILSPQIILLGKNIEYAGTTSFVPFHYFILFMPAAGLLAPFMVYGIYLFFRKKMDTVQDNLCSREFIKFLLFFLLVFFLVTGYRLLSIRYLAPVIPVFAILSAYFLNFGRKKLVNLFVILSIFNILVGYIAIMQYISPVPEIDKFPEFISRKSYFDANNVRKDTALYIKDNTNETSVVLTNAPAWIWVYTHRKWLQLPDKEEEFNKVLGENKNIDYLYVEPMKPYLENNTKIEAIGKTAFIEVYRVL